jgi:hypothetical protein
MLPPIAYELLGLALIALLVWIAWDSLRAREAAVAASRAACAARDVQFLDDTVAIESLRPARDTDGNLKLRRIYGFEYSDTGNNREKGYVVVLGGEVVLTQVGSGATWIDPQRAARDRDEAR